MVLEGGMECKQEDVAKTLSNVGTEPGCDRAEIEASHNAVWDLLNWDWQWKERDKQVSSLQKEGIGWQ